MAGEGGRGLESGGKLQRREAGSRMGFKRERAQSLLLRGRLFGVVCEESVEPHDEGLAQLAVGV